MTNKIDRLMEHAVKRDVFPAADLLAGHEGKILHQNTYGKAREGTCFDIASLTKPICTATLCMLAIQDNKLKLSDPVSQWFKL
ncbi:MAG: serine hydrolase, partial [Deltaproteobacteria bacterium]|nr:serine hydrolase [Deltaproteobacteria bacterium]